MKAVGKGSEEEEREIREHIVRASGTSCVASGILQCLSHHPFSLPFISNKMTEHFAGEVLYFFLLSLSTHRQRTSTRLIVQVPSCSILSSFCGSSCGRASAPSGRPLWVPPLPLYSTEFLYTHCLDSKHPSLGFVRLRLDWITYQTSHSLILIVPPSKMNLIPEVIWLCSMNNLDDWSMSYFSVAGIRHWDQARDYRRLLVSKV